MWIPSHVGISGNEDIDKKPEMPHIFFKSPYFLTTSDLKSYLKFLISQSQQQYWSSLTINQFLTIKRNDFTPSSTLFRSNKKNTILTGLRIFRTTLTHSYLIKCLEPPSCNFCQNPYTTIPYILIFYLTLQALRNHYHFSPIIFTLLDNNSNRTFELFLFLQYINVTSQIQKPEVDFGNLSN